MANIGYLIKIIRFLTAAAFLFYNLPYKIKEKSNKQSFFPRTNSVSRLLLGFSCAGCKSHKPCECVSHFFSGTFAPGVLFDHFCVLGPYKNTGCFVVHKGGRGSYCQRVLSGNPHTFLNQKNPQICYAIPGLTISQVS